ncbi:Pre-mRNA-splicing factor RSE1 [Spathaspora sp. JA1]|nr:Pre-mRNA-splicing factor RSE1 [Spathaspora sp. JA1]
MSQLYLYNLTLKDSTHYTHTLLGQFHPKSPTIQYLILVSPTHLTLLEPNSDTGKLETIHSQRVIGVINQASVVRIDELDYVVLTSDSGNLTILKYDGTKFIARDNLPMCKNGWGRTYPGEFLAVDYASRCVFVGAIERNKLIYKLDSGELSSPIEVHSGSVCLSVCALDQGFDNNPCFACLEIEDDVIVLNYYQLDLGLNHIIKTRAEEIPQDCSYVVGLPSHIGGVLLLGTNWLAIESRNERTRKLLPLPRRKGQDTIITTHILHRLKKNHDFFILIQSQLGDLFKIVVDYDQDREIVRDVTVSYFDTIPPCISLNIFKSGFLFANVLNNDKLLYQFEKLGETSTTTIKLSTHTDHTDEVNLTLKALDNLALIDIHESLTPILDAKYSSNLSVLSSHYLKQVIRGIPTSTLVSSPIPFIPTSIFTTKLTMTSEYDSYLVVTSSLVSTTLVLSLGEVVEEVEDSKLITDQHTLAIQQIGRSSLIQVYTTGIRHIGTKVTDWYSPGGITIIQASTNNNQVIIAMSNCEVVYFEVDFDDQLIEYQQRLELSSSITSLCLGDTAKVAVIGCSDETIQVVSLDESDCLEVKSLQALSSNATSLIMIDDVVHIGMENGVIAKSRLDRKQLRDTRVQYLGSRPILMSKLTIGDQTSILAISNNKAWISYTQKTTNTWKVMPLLDIDIIDASSFTSEEMQGIVGIQGNELVIFQLGNNEDDEEEAEFDFNREWTIKKQVRLRYTPRNMIVDKDKTYIVETQYGITSPYNQEDIDQDYYDAFGYERAKNGTASCIQVVQDESIVQSIEIEHTIISMTKVTFKNEPCLIIGITTNQKYLPTSHDECYLYTYTLEPELKLLHKTKLSYKPTVLLAFNNRLIVGSGNHIFLYELGKSQLLRKSTSIISYLSNINSILHIESNRIVITDASSSCISYAKYDSGLNQFIPFADDVTKRQITAITSLDYDTVVSGDKFGNIRINRLDQDISRQSDESWSLVKHTDGLFNSTSSKLSNLATIYVHDIPVKLLKVDDAIIWTGLMGTITGLLPLLTTSEVEWLNKLQISMRNHTSFNILDKDHLKSRSYYDPVKCIIDGDLLEMYHILSQQDKLSISRSINRSPGEIEKKLESLRNRIKG